jgi:hypothetical protein
MATPTPNKPSYQSPLVRVNRIIAPEWLRWFNQIQTSTAAVANLEAELAKLEALVAADQANIATLQAQMAAVQKAQAAADAALAALAATVANLQALVNLHTVQLTAQQAEIDALAAASDQFDRTEAWTSPRDWSTEIEELRRLFAMLDAPLTPAVLDGLYDPLGAAAAAQAASDPLGTALLLTGGLSSLTPQLDDLRRQFAMLDPPMNPAILAGLFDPLGAAAAVLASSLQIANNLSDVASAATSRTNLAAPGLADANTFTNTNTFKLPSGGTLIDIDTGVSLAEAGIALYHHGALKWLVIKQADATFAIYDQANARNLLETDGSGNLVVDAPASSFAAINASAAITSTVNTPTAASIQGGPGSTGGLDIESGVQGTDSRIYMGATSGPAPGVFIDSPTNITLRRLDGLASIVIDASAQQVTFPAPASLTFGSNWQSWTPTVTGVGTMTVSSLIINNASYLILGPLVFVELFVTVNIGGALSPGFTVSLPVAAQGDLCTLACNLVDPVLVAWQPAVAFVTGAGSPVSVLKAAGANFSAAGTANIQFCGLYRTS